MSPLYSEQVSGADVRVPGEAARLRGGVRAELPHAGEALHPRPGDRRRPLQGQLDQDSRQVHTVTSCVSLANDIHRKRAVWQGPVLFEMQYTYRVYGSLYRECQSTLKW